MCNAGYELTVHGSNNHSCTPIPTTTATTASAAPVTSPPDFNDFVVVTEGVCKQSIDRVQCAQLANNNFAGTVPFTNKQYIDSARNDPAGCFIEKLPGRHHRRCV